MTNTPKRRFFSGSTLEAALVLAASEYGIPVEEIAYNEIEKRHGFLRVRRNVVIEVDPESPRRAEGEPAPKIAPVPERRTPPLRTESDSEEPTDADDEAEDGQAATGPEDEGGTPSARPRRRRASGPAVPAAAVAAGPGNSEDKEDDGVEESHDEGFDFGSEDDIDQGDEEGYGGPAGEDGDEEADDRPSRAGGRRRRSAAPSRREESAENTAGEGRRRSRRRSRTRRSERPAREKRELQPIEERLKEARGPEADAVLEATEWLLDLVDLDVDPKVFSGDERYEVELRGDDREVVVSEDGKVLTALEHLLPRVLHGVHGEALPVRVDSLNFQEGREERLRDTAYRLADEVRASGMPEVLEPMDPADRRIVHLALGDEPEVDTKSLGNGFYKRVKIIPAEY